MIPSSQIQSPEKLNSESRNGTKKSITERTSETNLETPSEAITINQTQNESIISGEGRFFEIKKNYQKRKKETPSVTNTYSLM